MRILITGGCGFLGSNLASDALIHGDDLLVFDNLHREGSRLNLDWLKTKGDFIFRHGDIRNFNDISSAVLSFNPDVIFHLAGQVAMTTSIMNPRYDFEVNALGTFNLLESVRQYASDAIVLYSSTNKVYGDLNQYQYAETDTRYICVDKPNGIDEMTHINFSSPYGCSKGSADQYMLDYARIYGIKSVVFRHSSMYGGRQYATFDQGWVSWFCQKALEVCQNKQGSTFVISGSGKQVRDVLHADDMKRLYRAALANIDTVMGQVFNIGGGVQNSLSLLELFDMLEKIANIEMAFSKSPVRESDQQVFIADISKAKKMLAWEPRVSAQLGVKRMYEWVLENNYHKKSS